MNSGEDSSPPSSCKIPNKVAVLSVVSEIKHEERQKDMPSLYTHSLRPVDYGTKWKWKHLFFCVLLFNRPIFHQHWSDSTCGFTCIIKTSWNFKKKANFMKSHYTQWPKTFGRSAVTPRNALYVVTWCCYLREYFRQRQLGHTLLPSSASVCISWYDYVLNINSDYLTR